MSTKLTVSERAYYHLKTRMRLYTIIYIMKNISIYIPISPLFHSRAYCLFCYTGMLTSSSYALMTSLSLHLLHKLQSTYISPCNISLIVSYEIHRKLVLFTLPCSHVAILVEYMVSRCSKQKVQEPYILQYRRLEVAHNFQSMR